jgi:hypothetical protein
MKFQDLTRAGLLINCESYQGFFRTDVPIATGDSLASVNPIPNDLDG